MANMTNIKTKTYILGLSAAIMLCGCGNVGNEQPNINTEASSSTSGVYTSITEKNTETTEITKPTEITETTEAITAAEATTITEEAPSVPNDKSWKFEVSECHDDKIVPAEWIPVCSFAEAAKNFDEVVSSDVSKTDTADAIIALANKNVIFVDTFQSLFWEADMNRPYYSKNYKNPFYPDKPIYPILLSPEYYTDIQEIFDLGEETYTENAIEDFYTIREGILGKCFMKENGVSYVDIHITPNWNFTPFIYRTYIEILNETEDRCSFIWHRPDWEKLNEPEEGYEFYYYSCDCEAVYENGSWKLSKVYIEGYSLI